MKNLLFVLSLFISTSVHSVEYAVDSIAEVAEGEVAKFYPNSVRDKYGEKYFEVMIRKVDIQSVAPQALFS
ncbi:MAG: hypothetical protein HOJ43_00035, partial [Betaproteobacteria bacterium]|nr:hypothetical protein [Betaproteobacteria bacterium]